MYALTKGVVANAGVLVWVFRFFLFFQMDRSNCHCQGALLFVALLLIPIIRVQNGVVVLLLMSRFQSP